MGLIRKKQLIINVGLAGVMYLLFMALPGDGWQMQLQVLTGISQHELLIGQRVDATDAFDRKYDLMMTDSPSPHVALVGNGGLYRQNVKDLRTDKVTSWEITVQADRGLQAVFMWNGPIPGDARLVMFDEVNNLQVDMARTNAYVFTSVGENRFRIEAIPAEQRSEKNISKLSDTGPQKTI